MKDDSEWKEHTNPIVHQERELTVLEQEWKLKMVEKLSLQEELRVEKDCQYNLSSGAELLAR